MPMTKPETALIDLNLPKGEGIRLACRLRATTQTLNVTQAFFWTTAIDCGDFQQSRTSGSDFVFSRRHFHAASTDTSAPMELPLALIAIHSKSSTVAGRHVARVTAIKPAPQRPPRCRCGTYPVKRWHKRASGNSASAIAAMTDAVARSGRSASQTVPKQNVHRAVLEEIVGQDARSASLLRPSSSR